MSELTIKDLLGIDFDDKGLAETIDSVTTSVGSRALIHELIGKAIFNDGGLLEDEELNPNKLIKDISFDDSEVMKALCYYAANTESFMSRLKG